MRILLVNHRYFVASGAERYLFNIERVLNQAGHETAPFSIAYRHNAPSRWSSYFTSPIGNEEEVFFDQHRRKPSTFGKTFSRLFYSREVERDLARMIAAFRPDVAYIMLYRRKLSPSVLSALRKAGIPIIVRVSDYSYLCEENHFLRDGRSCTQCLPGRLWPGVYHACVRDSHLLSAINATATYFHRRSGFFDWIDRFVTTNEFLTQMMVLGGFEPERLACIPTFTDDKLFAARSRQAGDYLLYVGRLDPSKGVETLIEAMALLKQRRENAAPMLLIVGSGQSVAYERSLRSRVEAAGLKDRITFRGEVEADAIPEAMSRAIATIIPSLWFENLPNTFIESLFAGVPVIASDLGSLSHAIADGRDGLLFPPGNPAALASTIERLLDDPGLDADLRREGPLKARQNYSAERHLEKLLGLFEELLEARSAGAAYSEPSSSSANGMTLRP